MKQTFYLLFLACCFISLINKEAPIPNTGLIAYYSFNNCDAKDETDNGSDGKLYGNVGCWCGVEGNGLLFDGQNGYVEFGGMVNQYFTTSDLTVSFYFKTTNNTIFRESMLSKRDSCNANNMLDIQLNRQFNSVDTYFHETTYKDYGEISPIIDGSGWYHYALVRQGIKAYTYINGQLRREGFRCSGVDIDNDALLAFANSPCVKNGTTRPFKGVLDELRIFDKALTHEEILTIYSRYPVEQAEVNCVTFTPEKNKKDDIFQTESSYICSNTN